MWRFVAVLVLFSILAGAVPAAAAEPTPEDAALASQLQLSAIEAMNAGDWKTAEDRARAALTLDAGVRTSQARLVLVRALEQRGAVRDALAELDVLLGMELLPQHRAKAEEVQERLRARGPLPPGPIPDAARAPLGIALMGGGAVPTVVGATFIGFDVHFASQGVESGTWAVLGAALLTTGVVLEVVGAHVLFGPPGDPTAMARPRPRWAPTVGVAPRGLGTEVQLGVVGRW